MIAIEGDEAGGVGAGVMKVTRLVTSTPVMAVPPPVKSQVAYTAVLWYGGVEQELLLLIEAEGTIEFRTGSST